MMTDEFVASLLDDETGAAADDMGWLDDVAALGLDDVDLDMLACLDTDMGVDLGADVGSDSSDGGSASLAPFNDGGSASLTTPGDGDGAAFVMTPRVRFRPRVTHSSGVAAATASCYVVPGDAGLPTTVCLPSALRRASSAESEAGAAWLSSTKPATMLTRAPASKRQRCPSSASTCSEVEEEEEAWTAHHHVAATRQPKRQRTGAAPTPVSEDAALAARQAEFESMMASVLATVDSEANETRLQILASVKRNGNYDSYVGNAALAQKAIPLQVSLVGTAASPGLLTALQHTKRKGVTDRNLTDAPRGIPKWCLFFRTIFGRMSRLRCLRRGDPLFEAFRTTGALRQLLEECPSNAARVQFLADNVTRLVAFLRPEEQPFALPPTFLHGITPYATVENCLKLQCQACNAVQGWRTCRGCYKAKRQAAARRAKQQRAQQDMLHREAAAVAVVAAAAASAAAPHIHTPACGHAHVHTASSAHPTTSTSVVLPVGLSL